MNPSIVYVKLNDSGYITDIDSNVFLSDTTDWVDIDQGYGDKFYHAQNNYFSLPIRTGGFAYHYKLVNGKPVECTPEEIAAQEEANKPLPVEPEVSVWDELDKAYQSGIDSI